MKERCAFVPCGQEFLATTVTVPDTEPRGLVSLCTGIGAVRSHRFQMWARVAEDLAARGIASVRFEYAGMHDSTGSVSRPMLDEDWTDQLRAVVDFAKRATGTSPVIAAGNCIGATMSLQLAAESTDCIGVFGLIPPFGEAGGVEASLRRATGRRTLAFLKSSSLGRGIVKRLRRLRRRDPVPESLPRALAHADVWFVFGSEANGSADVAARLRTAVARLPDGQRRRLQITEFPEPHLDRFSSVGAQQLVLDKMVEWIDDRFSAAANQNVGV